jgi:hypothetical protein
MHRHALLLGLTLVRELALVLRVLTLLHGLTLLREGLAVLGWRLLGERLLLVRRLLRLPLGLALGLVVLRELLRRRSVTTRLAGVRVLRGLGRGCGHGCFLKDVD